jgi:hypothetical protein
MEECSCGVRGENIMNLRGIVRSKIVIGFVSSIVLLGLAVGIVRYLVPPNVMPPDAAIAVARQAGYDAGYALGYQKAHQEQANAYNAGYEAARSDLKRGLFLTYGLTGLLLGAGGGLTGVAILNRKTLTARIRAFQKQQTLKKAFARLPANLSPELALTAEQLAKTYGNIWDQLHTAKGHTVERYAQQWQPQLQTLMDKAVNLMELIQELETARANVNPPQLDQTIVDLQHAIRRTRDEDLRNETMKALRRAKQTQTDLAQTTQNLTHCKTALQGMTRMLDSLHLKISNIKVNTQRTELLDELSSDLETEMTALEEALRELAPLPLAGGSERGTTIQNLISK